ncbi:MAG: Cys-Gln thioester bond-forming surface protein, partial [Firmicutes bacterium]|nr:Cys-Gln thioester bond-forming surface protein [Bacillota bacterium]
MKETVKGTHYRRLNLEEADYYEKDAAEHIRAIVQNSYPFVSLDEMKASLKAAGFENADQLNRGEIIAAVQMA